MKKLKNTISDTEFTCISVSYEQQKNANYSVSYCREFLQTCEMTSRMCRSLGHWHVYIIIEFTCVMNIRTNTRRAPLEGVLFAQLKQKQGSKGAC